LVRAVLTAAFADTAVEAAVVVGGVAATVVGGALAPHSALATLSPHSDTFFLHVYNTYSTDSALCMIITQYLWISGLRLLFIRSS